MLRIFIFTAAVFLCIQASSWAQTAPTFIPGAADAGRIDLNARNIAPTTEQNNLEIPSTQINEDIPAEAKEFQFHLVRVTIEGATVFSNDRLRELYAPYLYKDVKLDIVWKIANEITALYRDKGYFLSRAYVPAQNIKDGRIRIKIVEGYIGAIDYNGDVKSPDIVRQYAKDLTQIHPVTSYEVESFLLRVNDTQGLIYRAVLSPLENPPMEGAVLLTLTPEKEEPGAIITFDNYGSRFLGPHELSGTFNFSIAPLHETNLTVLSDMEAEELHYGALRHSVAMTPALKLILDGSLTKATPGYTLKQFEIESESVSANIGLEYQWLRQRQENLALSLTFGGRNTENELLGTELTRDRIRVVRLGAEYSKIDSWNGYNLINAKVSQGVGILGASEEDDLNLSREEAVPDFTKIEISATRLQSLSPDWMVNLMVGGQFSLDPLYSSEEFGYGGAAIGRAYDSSELTGDHGVAASVELQYNGLPEMDFIHFFPYAFYDIGTVWNKDDGQQPKETGSSIGVGFKFETDYNFSGNFAVAVPLIRDIDTPLYGRSESGPRLLFQISKRF